jgi:hypothetical protein
MVIAVAAIAHLHPAHANRATTGVPIACADDAESCELKITGTLVYARRDRMAKWDNLGISTVVGGKRTLVKASINIPHRTRLRLKPQTRYRFTIAARAPYGAGELWVIDARAI